MTGLPLLYLARHTRIELVTYPLGGDRSIQLSQWRMYGASWIHFQTARIKTAGIKKPATSGGKLQDKNCISIRGEVNT